MSDLLTSLLGEKRLASLGHPNLPPTSILEKVLRLTGTTITTGDDLCTDNCRKVRTKQLEINIAMPFGSLKLQNFWIINQIK